MPDWVEQVYQDMRRQKDAEAAEAAQKGGPGSGHWGHAGRPGKRGGSLPANVAVSIATGRTARERQAQAAGQGGQQATGRTAAETRATLQVFEQKYSQQLTSVREQMDANLALLDELGEKADRAFGTPDYGKWDDEITEAWKERNRLIEKERILLSNRKIESRSLLYVDDPATAGIKPVSRFDKERWARYQKGVEQFNKIVGIDSVNGLICNVRAKRGRAHAEWDGKAIALSKWDGASVTIHELGHWLEFNDPNIQKKALAFLERRTQDEPLVHLGDRYRPDEYARKDKFPHPYSGKDYKGRATEIVSMGLQQFYDDPVGFASADPEYFDFMYNLMRGQ